MSQEYRARTAKFPYIDDERYSRRDDDDDDEDDDDDGYLDPPILARNGTKAYIVPSKDPGAIQLVTRDGDLGTFVPSKKTNDDDDDKSDNNPKKADAPPNLSYFQLFKYATCTDKIMVILAVISSIITGLIAPLNTLVFADLSEAMVLNALILGGAPIKTDLTFSESITLYALRNLCLGTILFIFSYLATMLTNYAAHNQIFNIRKRFLQSALNQDIEYYDLNESGDFASRMNDDLLKLEDGIGEKFTICLHHWVSFFGCTIFAFVKGWKLALVCFTSFPITVILVSGVGIVTSRLAKKESLAYGVAASIAEEVLSSIRTVIAFGGEHKEAQRFRDNLIAAEKINVKRSFSSGLGFGVLFFCIYCSYALSFWYGVKLIIEEPETYQISVMVSAFYGILMGGMNFGMSTPFIEIFGIAKGAGSKIFSVIENKPKIDPLADLGLKPDKVKGNIIFKDVSFNYPSRSDVPVLTKLNLTVPNGKTIALVGSSGCGKSTCVQLIQRFYDPLSGSILLDKCDLRDLSVNWLRQNIGVVGQEPVLFNTTIYENIQYGFDDATKEEIENAARQANAHDFIIKLPKGYETLVGERGTQLSGGQKQRIAIARALVKNPKILLLDEATSALDNASEYKVQTALDKASKGRTTIIVAHRLSTIQNADIIVALDKGKVVEEGTHSELMALKGYYYNLVMAQATTTGEESPEESPLRQTSVERRGDSFGNGNIMDDEKIACIDDDAVEIKNREQKPETVPLWNIVQLNAPEWKFLIFACMCSFIQGIATPLFSVLFSDILGVLSGTDFAQIRKETNYYCVIFIIAGTITGLATFTAIFLYGIAGEKMTMRLRAKMFEAMLRQEIGWFDDKNNGTGALCARLSGEASAVQGATGQRIGTIIQSISTLIFGIGLSLYFEWRLALVALCFTPFTLVSAVLNKTVTTSENFGSSKSMEKSTKLAVDIISNIRTVTSLGRQKMFLHQFTYELLPALKLAKRNTHFRGLVYGIARSIIFFAFAGSIFYGGYLIENDGVRYENVLKVTQALIMSTVSIANALTFAPNLQKGIQAAGRIITFLNKTPQIVDPVNPLQLDPDFKSEVGFDKVNFAYPTRPFMQVLNSLVMDVPSGKTVALVGSSGCGKSTCIQLLERFYDPTSGQIILDKTPINNLKLGDLRRHLGIVSQEPVLFDRTIGENIAYGDNTGNPTDQDIIEAAKQANIHNFITSLPMGYDTRLGSRGVQLSGGQKQRVAIARALLRNPKILLLDEATSALDTESEKIVQEALDLAKMGRTCITIAHRLSTIRDADIIYVFHEGRIHESGTHAQLMDKKGIYYRLQTQNK